MRKLLLFIFMFLFVTSQLFASSSVNSHFKNKAEIRAMKRNVKTQDKLDKIGNKSAHSLKNMKLKQKKYYRRNFSFCDFKNTDIRGVIFEGCNLSFSINLDKAIIDKSTSFVRCNFTCADLPVNVEMKKCNKRQFTDKEIEEHFKKKGDIE